MLRFSAYPVAYIINVRAGPLVNEKAMPITKVMGIAFSLSLGFQICSALEHHRGAKDSDRD